MICAPTVSEGQKRSIVGSGCSKSPPMPSGIFNRFVRSRRILTFQRVDVNFCRAYFLAVPSSDTQYVDQRLASRTKNTTKLSRCSDTTISAHYGGFSIRLARAADYVSSVRLRNESSVVFGIPGAFGTLLRQGYRADPHQYSRSAV